MPYYNTSSYQTCVACGLSVEQNRISQKQMAGKSRDIEPVFFH